MNENMTILSWNDSSVRAPKGVVALLEVREYERYGFSDYGFGILSHYPEQTMSAFGVSDGHGHWDTSIVSPEGMFMSGGPLYPTEYAEVLRWAALPYRKERDNRVEIRDDEADRIADQLEDIPYGDFDSDSKYIR